MGTEIRGHYRMVAEQWARERPDLDIRDLMLGIGLMRMGRIVDSAYDKQCREFFRISGADMRVMLALRRSGRPFALRPTDLSRALLVTSGAITKQVDRLVDKKYVQRLSDSTYSGGFLVQLTREGLRVVDRATEDILVKGSLLRPLTAKLSEAERSAGERFVEYLIAGLEATHGMDSAGVRDKVQEISPKPAVRSRRSPGRKETTPISGIRRT